MSGHSKWANIKRKKEANDSKRSKVFSKMSRLITVAAKKGGGDEDKNPALRLAVEKAKQARMSKETIEKAIAKATGEDGGASYEEVIYEGFGAGGVAYYVEALTDNNNRTVSEIKTVFNKCGGSLGTPGSTSYIFSTDDGKPLYLADIDERDMEKNENLIDALEDHDDVQEVYTNLP